MKYLTKAVMVGVVITLFIWVATGFVAGTFDVMSFSAISRFGMVFIWCILQAINAGAWVCAYDQHEREKLDNKYH